MERSLHASLKDLFNGPNVQFEVPIDGYIIDVVSDGLLIEIQTRNFAAIKEKLFTLMKTHPIRLAHPIASEKWVIRQNPIGEEISRRRSPKSLRIENLFDELVSIPTYPLHHNFSLEVILIKEEEIRMQDGKGSWRRRGWSSIDRRLIDVFDRYLFNRPKDFLHLLPEDLKMPFTTKTLIESTGLSKRTAQRMTYCLRKMGVLRVVGKEQNAFLYCIA